MRKKPPRRAHVGHNYAGRLSDVIAIQIRDGNEAEWCPWCETRMEISTRDEPRGGPRTRTVEHIVPRSEGGTDRLDNLVLACRGCNNKRGKL